MAKTVAIKDIPTSTRSSGPGKYDAICKQLVDLVGNEKTRATSGIIFDTSDGVIFTDVPESAKGKDDGVKSNVSQVSQLLRLAAKAVGAKIKLVAREDGLYASYVGPYTELTEAQKKARKEAREANAAAKAMKAETSNA